MARFARLCRACVAYALTAVSLAMPSTAAAAVSIEHDPVGCVVADRFPQLDARFLPSEQVARARLHFQPEGGKHWYSVPFAKEGEAFRATMPKPRKSLKALRYYIEITDAAMAAVRTPETATIVAEGPAACEGKKVAGATGSATVALEAPVGAPAVPPGFADAGITTATASGAAAAAAGGGIGATTLIVGGLVVAGGAAAAVAASGEKDPLDSDDDGDGVSENAGDCDDTRAAVKPNGGFTYTADFRTQGTVSCASTAEWFGGNHTVTNNSCAPLTVNEYVFAHTLTCADGFGNALSNTRGLGITVGPGQSVRLPFPDPLVNPFVNCCPDAPCASYGLTSSCTDRDTHTVITSQGAQSLSQSITWNDAECPACPAGFGGTSSRGHAVGIR